MYVLPFLPRILPHWYLSLQAEFLPSHLAIELRELLLGLGPTQRSVFVVWVAYLYRG